MATRREEIRAKNEARKLADVRNRSLDNHVTTGTGGRKCRVCYGKIPKGEKHFTITQSGYRQVTHHICGDCLLEAAKRVKGFQNRKTVIFM